MLESYSFFGLSVQAQNALSLTPRAKRFNCDTLDNFGQGRTLVQGCIGVILALQWGLRPLGFGQSFAPSSLRYNFSRIGKPSSHKKVRLMSYNFTRGKAINSVHDAMSARWECACMARRVWGLGERQRQQNRAKTTRRTRQGKVQPEFR